LSLALRCHLFNILGTRSIQPPTTASSSFPKAQDCLCIYDAAQYFTGLLAKVALSYGVFAMKGIDVLQRRSIFVFTIRDLENSAILHFEHGNRTRESQWTSSGIFLYSVELIDNENYWFWIMDLSTMPYPRFKLHHAGGSVEYSCQDFTSLLEPIWNI
jgi:hypothetical protein